MKKIFFLLTILLISSSAFAQLPPDRFRDGLDIPFIQLDTLTTTQRDALVIPSNKTRFIYNKTVDSLQYYNLGTSSWKSLGGGDAGSGDVTKVGTPVNNQIGIWTGDGTLEGDANFTWDGTSASLSSATPRISVNNTGNFRSGALWSDNILFSRDGFNLTLQTPTLTGNYTLNYPVLTANDTFALLSDLSGSLEGYGSTGSTATNDLINTIGESGSAARITVNNNDSDPLLTRNFIHFNAALGGYIFNPSNFGFRFETPEGFDVILGGASANWGITAQRSIGFPDASGTIALEADPSGFNGNLTTTDNTLQEIAQKFDDFTSGGSQNLQQVSDIGNTTNNLLQADELVVDRGVANESYELTERGVTLGFPVVTARPKTADKVIAFDIMPNGTVVDNGSNGVAWLDIIDTDAKGSNPSLSALRLGIGTTRGTFGMLDFNGATAKPLDFVSGTAGNTVGSIGTNGHFNWLTDVNLTNTTASNLTLNSDNTSTIRVNSDVANGNLASFSSTLTYDGGLFQNSTRLQNDTGDLILQTPTDDIIFITGGGLMSTNEGFRLASDGTVTAKLTTLATVTAEGNKAVLNKEAGDGLYAPISITGDVSASSNIADNRLVRGDGGVKGIQQSGITIDDSDNITGVNEITIQNIDVHETLGNLITTGANTSGGVLSPNVDTTKFDISDGFGYVIDNFTTPETPIITKVTWSGLTANIPTYIATDPFSSIAINSSGTIVQQNTLFTQEQSRDLIVLGSIFHADNINITSVEDMARDPSSSYLAADLSSALGDLNISGNNFNPAATDLTIRKEAGRTFRQNANRNTNVKDPNFITSSVVNPVTFIYTYNDGTGDNAIVLGQTNIDPNQYDNGTGTLASVPAGNRWTNQWCYFFPGSNVLVVRYGEAVYNSLDEAKSAALIEIPTTIGSGFNTEFIRTVITVKVGTTDLTDSEVAFTNTGKFGLSGGVGGSGGGSTQDLQDTYNNSVTPEILTDGTRGAVTIQEATATDTANILEGKNNAGTTTFSVTGEGRVKIADAVNSDEAVSKSQLDAVTTGLLSQSSTITTSRNALLTDADGMNVSTSAFDVTITIPTNASVAFPVGTVLVYQSNNNGNILIRYAVGVTGEDGQTYENRRLIRVWKTATDTWQLIDEPVADQESITLVCSDLVTDITTGTSKQVYFLPFDFFVEEVIVTLDDPGTTTGITVDINNNGTSILSTLLTTDAGENTSEAPVTPAVISTNQLNKFDKITIDFDAVPTSATGVQVHLNGFRHRTNIAP